MQAELCEPSFLVISSVISYWHKYHYGDTVDGEEYYTKRLARDNEAREQYFNVERLPTNVKNDLFIIDIIRQELKQDNERLQREIFK